jgi:hypothetical protein
MSGNTVQQGLIEGHQAVMPASHVLKAAQSLPAKTVEDLQGEHDALMAERAQLINRHNESIQRLQAQANELVEAHNAATSRITTRLVELQGGIKLLNGEL